MEVIKQIITDTSPKSCDLDPAPTWLVVESVDELLPILSRIITTSLQSSTVPDKFKIGYISPLIKKPGLNSESLHNYRPVQNLSFVSKVIERVVAQQLTSHMRENNLHEQMQSAYRQNHSTETALLKVHSDILSAVDNGCVVVLVLLDLTAAFDTIDHAILLSRLRHIFGVTGAALDWLRSYLANRKQLVRIGSDNSFPTSVPFGIPQGSVLGPLLFTAYITPLGDLIRKYGLEYHVYADDMQIYISFPPGGDAQSDALNCLHRCLEDTVKWAQSNLLKLNDQKTDVVVFGTKHKLPVMKDIRITVGGSTLRPSSHVRNLGVIFDSTLTIMTNHISTICRTAYMHLHNISRIRRYLTPEATKSLVHAFIMSRLDYGNALLAGLPLEHLKKLQRIQKIAARIISFTPRRDHITPILKQLHWLPIKRRIEFKILLHVFRCINGTAPRYLADMLKRQCSTGRTRSSQQHLLEVPRTKLVSFGDRSFNVVGPRLWNALPIAIKRIDTVPLFVKALKTHIFKEEFC